MPFTARNTETGELVFSLNFVSSFELRMAHKVDLLVCPCPDCGHPVYARGGERMRSVTHFAHKPKAPCKTRMGHHPESIEHILGKIKVYTYLKKDLGPRFNGQIHLEYPLRDAGVNGRIADVLIEFPFGGMTVYEVQLAAISIDELKQRTEDYANLGIDCYWVLGGNASSPANKQWCERQIGAYYTLPSVG